MSFGKWLSDRRNTARLTQVQLAERAGISPNYVSALERDEPNARDGSPRRPRIDKVERMAKALGVPVDDALKAAGYAGREPETKVHQLMATLEAHGIDGSELFGGFNQLANMTDAQYERLIEDVVLAIKMNVDRLVKKAP